MQLIEDIDSFNNNGLALTIGFFDGVHVGHRFLLEQLQNIANKENLQSAILTFWPHPRIVLNEEYKPLMINDWDEKVTLLNNTTLDICIKTAFTKSLANFTAFEFIKDVLVDKLNVKHLLIGYDHRFGKNREKGFDDYCKYGEILGVKVTKAESYSENENKISSSFIRRLLLTGNVKKVSHLLGYNYTIRGVVVPGFKIGRTINFPTANIDLQFKYKALPILTL